MNLGFDIDGVISDFAKARARVVKKHYNLKLDETEMCYHDLSLLLGISKEESNQLVKQTLLGGSGEIQFLCGRKGWSSLSS